MAYHYEKDTGDLVIDGWEKGIAPSPHKGIANLQNVNISTETGEAMISYSRTLQTVTTSTAVGALTFADASHVNLTMPLSNNLFKGFWITVSNSSHTGELANGTYWVLQSSGPFFVLSATYGGTGISGYTAGLTADFVLLRNMGKAIASATEPYSQSSPNPKFRYYILDNQGLVWVYDTATASVSDRISWFLPDNNVSTPGATASGLAILNGWIFVFAGTTIWCKSTSFLGATPGWSSFASGTATGTSPHFAYTGHQGRLYYTDGNFLGSIFPNTSLVATTSPNIQSYAQYNPVTTVGTITNLIGGSLPTLSINGSLGSVPCILFTGNGGTISTALQALSGSSTTASAIVFVTGGAAFSAYRTAADASTNTNPIDLATGASGSQFLNTFYPISAVGEATITFTPQRLNLPFFETTTALTEIGSTLIIGTRLNVLYPWNQVDPIPGDIIPLPENNTTFLLTVNNMAYVLAGNKGNIYLTNGSTASLALTVPDYCAGIPGTESSYVEPYFIWGGAAYIRGRVYFSILDQTTTKAGNCGGIWSFVPTQNFFIGQDFGLALRLENQNSYHSYNGVATVILASQNQAANSPQYWSAWYSSVSSPLYGIDFVAEDFVSTPALIETDLIQVGTLLGKKTFQQVEYKLAAPLVFPEAVSIAARFDGTSTYTPLTGINLEDVSTDGTIAGYFTANFQNIQWLQLQITLTAGGESPIGSSFVRLKEIKYDNMDEFERRVRDIAQDILDSNETVDQYAVSQTPFHTHNGSENTPAYL